MAIAGLQLRLQTLVAMSDNFQGQILMLSNREQEIANKSDDYTNKILKGDKTTDNDSSLATSGFSTETQYEAQMKQFSDATKRLETQRKNLETQNEKCQADMQSIQSTLDKEIQNSGKLFN